MSAKTSTQPGRRTPLSLTGAVPKAHSNKVGGNTANGSGNNTNGHATSNNKQDNKVQNQRVEQQANNNADYKDTPNKKQQQADRKQLQQQQQQPIENSKKTNEKNQNGLSSKQELANENKQQQIKDKQLSQNISENKMNDKDKREKFDKQDNAEKEETRVKDDKKSEPEKHDNKKEDKRVKEVKESKEDKKEDKIQIDKNIEKFEQIHQETKTDDKAKEGKEANCFQHKPEETMNVEEQVQIQDKSTPVTPKTSNKATKTSTPVNKTPTKLSEKTPQKLTPTVIRKREVTTTIDDVEMEALAVESSPIKSTQLEEVARINVAPSATSTPGKICSTTAIKSDVQLAMQAGKSPERPRVFSQISGRKSIRPISDYTPSKFSNSQFRESYRRINTELDVTNTSMNVTVGSEVPNNLSFSFFGRGRKRDRTPPQHSQSAIGELQTDMDISPPKRVRLDVQGFFSAVSSPLTLLRNRFSKATLESSTPVKLEEKLNTAEDEIEVQNVSGVSVHEDISKPDKDSEINTSAINDTSSGQEAKENKSKNKNASLRSQGGSGHKECEGVFLKCEKICGSEQTCEEADIKITETPLQTAAGNPMGKNKRCVVM